MTKLGLFSPDLYVRKSEISGYSSLDVDEVFKKLVTKFIAWPEEKLVEEGPFFY